MVGLAVATRPDCVNKEILTLLRGYQKDHLVWIEYGLQSAHDKTLNRINRGHDVACFEECVRMTRDFGLETCAHIILGLPGEDREMMRHTARFLSSLPVQGVKIHLLYLVQGTPLAESHGRGEFRCLDREAYADLVVDVLELLRPDMVIHRLTGDPPKNELVAPSWATDKTANLRLINEVLNQRNTWQGRLWKPSGVGNLR
jgi:hypothetical protein